MEGVLQESSTDFSMETTLRFSAWMEKILLPYMTIHVQTWLFWKDSRTAEAIKNNTELFSDKQKHMSDFSRTNLAKF